MAKRIQVTSSPEDKALLERYARSGKTEHTLALRAKIVLGAIEGKSTSQLMKDLGISAPTVIKWRKRFAEKGIQFMYTVLPRGRSFQSLSPEKEAEIIEKTQKKPENATHWSCRTMAKVCGVSKASVQRVWHANGLKPHLVKTFKISKDPRFVQKINDVVGLYMNPPENALVLSVDEKSQIQALDRTQPGLPMKKGHASTMTHDYKRNGTTTLFAALNVLKGEVIGQCMPRHRHQEFLAFLENIDRQTPQNLNIHCIVDNYSTHKKKEITNWLAIHTRFHLHFIPTSSPWLNLVERWFGEITRKRIRRGSFPSVTALEQAIQDYIEHNNKNPKPFIWTSSAENIVNKVNRVKHLRETPH